MTKATFSPGPWIAHEDRLNDIGVYMVEPDGSCGPQVARVLTENIDDQTFDQARADAALIAASPAMFEICEELCCTVGEDGELNFRTADLSLVELRAMAAKIVANIRGEKGGVA
jgi:hypothetical protein